MIVAHRRLFIAALIGLYPFFLLVELSFVFRPLAEMLIYHFQVLFHALFFVIYPVPFTLLLLSIRTRPLNKLFSFLVFYTYLLPYYYSSTLELPFEFYHAFFVVPLILSSASSLLIATLPHVYELAVPGVLAKGGKSMKNALRYIRSREFLHFTPLFLLIPFAGFKLYPLMLLIYLAFRRVIVDPKKAPRLIPSDDEILKARPIRSVLVLPSSPGGYALGVIANLGTLSLMLYLSLGLVAANVILYEKAVEFVSITSIPAVIAMALRRTLIGLKMRSSRIAEERERFVLLRFAL